MDALTLTNLLTADDKLSEFFVSIEDLSTDKPEIKLLWNHNRVVVAIINPHHAFITAKKYEDHRTHTTFNIISIDSVDKIKDLILDKLTT